MIGIDPRPRILQPIRSRAKLYPLTSDEFFEKFNVFEELGRPRLDFAFIDGLHLFEQVLKDFLQLEPYANEQTVFLVHDCLPVTRLAAARNRVTKFWCGDVWKVIPILREYRPDLSIHLIPTTPSGLGIITNLDPRSTVLRDNYEEIRARFLSMDLDCEYLDLNGAETANLLSNDWQQIAQVLPAPAPRS